MPSLSKRFTPRIIVSLCLCSGIAVIGLNDRQALSTLPMSSADASVLSLKELDRLEHRLEAREQQLLQLQQVLQRSVSRRSSSPTTAAMPLLQSKLEQTTNSLDEITQALAHIRLYKANQNLRTVLREVEQQGRGQMVDVDAVPAVDISASIKHWKYLVNDL